MASYTTSQNPGGAPAAGPAADSCAFDPSADYAQSFHLRVAAFFIICACSSAGVLVPLMTRLRPSMNGTQRGGWLFIAKAFGAGVILAVGLIHVFPDASTTLSDPCLGWVSYPWAGMIATLSAIGVLILEGLITSMFERLHAKTAAASQAPAGAAGNGSATEFTTANVYGHAHDPESTKQDKVRHLTIAQVLEAGIAVHSVLIGVALGVSSDLGTVRSLLAALAFHQFFEGVALGACFIEAAISSWSYAVMGAIFALSTPLGIAIGLGVQSTYNEHSPTALAVEGIFDSISAGILIFMALVDLIAVDFMEAKRPLRSKALGYVLLFMGSLCMGIIAIWA